MNSNNRDERLENVAQKMETGNPNPLTHVNGRQPGGSSISGTGENGDKLQRIPEVVNDIIMKDSGDTDEDEYSIKKLKSSRGSLKPSKGRKFSFDEVGFESVEQLKSANETLKNHLYKIEDDLIRVKAERDTIVIKYNALNERINKSLTTDKSLGRRMSNVSEDCVHINTMAELNLQLRKQLDDDHREYKEKLYCQQQQQLKQADLIQKLHNKLNELEGNDGVIERYKNENDKLRYSLSKLDHEFKISTNDLNKRLDAAENQLRLTETDRSMNVESVLAELKEEKAKFVSLAQVNAMIREQLEDATNANSGLTEDVQKLTEDWQLIRNELEQKDFECRDDEAAFSRYLASEQSRIKTLWSNVSNFKKQFNDIKTSNERDLHQIRMDVENATQSLRLACSNFDTNNRSKINQMEFQMESERNTVNQLETLAQKLKEDLRKAENQYQKQLETINEQNNQLKQSNDSLIKELEDKEKTLNILHKLRNGISADVESSGFVSEDAAHRQLIIDTDAVHQALRDIAQIIVNETDQLDDSPWIQDDGLDDSRTNMKTTFSTNSLHSNRSVSPVRTPKRIQNTNTSSADKQRMFFTKSPVSVADSTCAAVRSAFQKRALQVQDLISKLTSMKNNTHNLKKQLDDSENERRNLETQLIELRRGFDSNHRELDDIQRECERMRHTVAMLDDDKSKFEKSRQSLLEESKLDKQEMEKLKMNNYELKRDMETATDNISEIQRNMERQVKEVERLNKSLEMSDGKNSKLREEMLSYKESLNKISLEKDILEQEKSVITDSLNKSEVAKAEYEVKLNKQRTEEAKMKDKIHQQELLFHSLNKDFTECKLTLEKTEFEKNRLTTERKALEQEKYGIREELLRVENEKEELHQLKHGLHESIQSVEKSYETLQDELSKLNCEKIDLEKKNAIVLKERNALSNELLQARKDAETLSTAVQKLIKDKENLFNEKSDVISQLKTLERNIRESNSDMYLVREEKEQIERDLYESQQTIIRLEVNISTLDGNIQELERKRSALFNENKKMNHEFDVELQKQTKLKDLLQMKFAESEKEWNRNLNIEKKSREEDIERLIGEREELRRDFANYKDQIKKESLAEIEEVRMRLNKDKEGLAMEIITIQRERDDFILEAEMGKQYAINLLEQEKNALVEKISYLMDALKTTELDLDRTRSECEARTHQDQDTIQLINSDLKKFRIQFEQTHAEHDREIKNLQNSYKDLENIRFQDLREIDELKSLLKIAEETKESLRQDLMDLLARIRESEDNKERLRRELQDEKRNYFEEKKEAETLQASNKELRQKLKQSEILKIDLQRQVQDIQHKLSVTDEHKSMLSKELKEIKFELQETETARQNVRRELEDLRNHVKKLDTERGKLSNEVGDLQTRVSSDECKEVKARKENLGLKQKIMESEAKKEELSKKLYHSQRIIDDLEESVSVKEKVNRQNYDELFNECKRLEDLKESYEHQIQSFASDIDEKKSALLGKDDKINLLENTLSMVDLRRKEAETRIGLIHTHLRKLIGFRQQAPATIRNKSPSPQRRSRSISPDKGRTSGRESIEINKYSDDRRNNDNFGDSSSFYEGTIPGSDLEPEAVRMALQDITEHIANLEKERDNLEIKAKNLSLKEQEANAALDQALQRICMMQSNLGEIEEDRKGVDGRLACAQTALLMQEETITRNEREKKTMINTLNKLEKQLLISETDKQYLQDRVDKMRKTETYYEEEKRCLVKAIDDAENRCTQLELLRRGLEGELQRLKMGFNDKETENQVLRDRIECLIKQISDLESKSQSLQLTIDRLSMNLARTEEEENTQKDKVHQLHLSLNENQNNVQDLQEKIQQLQSNLASSEHDRRVLHERLESLKQNLAEAKSQNHNLTDRLQSVLQELSETESRRNELETELKHLNQILTQRQEIENELQMKLHKAAMEKNLLTERLNGLTASLVGLESDRKSIEKSHNMIEKERHVLQKTLNKLEKEKNRTEEIVTGSLLKRTEFDESIRRLENENEILQRQVQKMQNQLAEAEQCHAQRIMDLSARIKSEMLSEMDRLKSALSSAEKTLEFREKSHRQKVKGLEEQINLLKDQLSKELKKRESYLTKSRRNIKTDKTDIRNLLENSTNSISKMAVDSIIYDNDQTRRDNFRDTFSPSTTLKAIASNRLQMSKLPLHSVNFETPLTRQTNTLSPNRLHKSNSFVKRSLNNE